MTYVRRDAAGKVIALSIEPLDAFEAGATPAEIAEFEGRIGNARSRLQESDLEIIRVLDDLVNVLVEKNVIRFTDLPVTAQGKLLERRDLREHVTRLRLLDEDAGLL
jgi:hypothetical protein